MNNVIETIKSQLNDPIKYRVVFDVDDVLSCSPILLGVELHSKVPETLEKEVQQYPACIQVYWQHQGRTYLHFFYPDLDKLILSILSWKNWSVDFFSFGIRERNETVLPEFLKQALSRYIDNPTAVYEIIANSDRLRIFSRHHMVQGSESKKLSGYETFGNYKKDLTVVSDDIANTILIDDDRSYIVASQYPFISTSYSFSSKFRDRLRSDTEHSRELVYDPLKNAGYIMGILLSCKEKLDSGEVTSVRSGLDLVLQHNTKTVLKPAHRDYSPWFLHPTYECDSSNPEFLNYMTRWIEKGEEYWMDKFPTAVVSGDT